MSTATVMSQYMPGAQLSPETHAAANGVGLGVGDGVGGGVGKPSAFSTVRVMLSSATSMSSRRK